MQTNQTSPISETIWEQIKKDFIVILKPDLIRKELIRKESVIQDEKRLRVIIELLEQAISEVSYLGLLDESTSQDLKYLISDFIENHDISEVNFSELGFEEEEDFSNLSF